MLTTDSIAFNILNLNCKNSRSLSTDMTVNLCVSVSHYFSSVIGSNFVVIRYRINDPHDLGFSPSVSSALKCPDNEPYSFLNRSTDSSLTGSRLNNDFVCIFINTLLLLYRSTKHFKSYDNFRT